MKVVVDERRGYCTTRSFARRKEDDSKGERERERPTGSIYLHSYISLPTCLQSSSSTAKSTTNTTQRRGKQDVAVMVSGFPLSILSSSFSFCMIPIHPFRSVLPCCCLMTLHFMTSCCCRFRGSRLLFPSRGLFA